MGKMKVTVTIEEEIVEDLDRLAGKIGGSRSRLIEEALRTWRRSRLEKELIEGYKAMSKENARMAEEYLAAGVEALK